MSHNLVINEPMGGTVSSYRVRRQLAFGWAEYDGAAQTRVGDRLVPRVIDVQFPSTDDLPAPSMRIEVRKGVPVCTKVTVEAKPDGREVRPVDLRAVRIDDWVEEIVAATSGRIEESGSVLYQDGADARRAATATIRTARQGSRRQVTDALLRRVAEVYRDHVNDRPVMAVMSAFGTSHRTAARYVQLSREAGHLPPTSPGKKRG